MQLIIAIIIGPRGDVWAVDSLIVDYYSFIQAASEKGSLASVIF